MSHARSLHKEIRLQVEQQEVELPSIEGLIFINIPRCPAGGGGRRRGELGLCPAASAPAGYSSAGEGAGPCSLHPHPCIPPSLHSWGSGADLWGSDSDSRFEKPRMDDGLLEVVGVTGVMHMVSMGAGGRCRGCPRRALSRLPVLPGPGPGRAALRHPHRPRGLLPGHPPQGHTCPGGRGALGAGSRPHDHLSRGPEGELWGAPGGLAGAAGGHGAQVGRDGPSRHLPPVETSPHPWPLKEVCLLGRGGLSPCPTTTWPPRLALL